jgi:hypothetical protein
MAEWALAGSVPHGVEDDEEHVEVGPLLSAAGDVLVEAELRALLADRKP